MTTITFISASDGTTTSVEATDGFSLMEAARLNGVSGVVAECSGCAMCCTCHVYIGEEWVARLPAVGEQEDALLEGAASPRQPNSRLSCQITVGPELNGLVVTVPPQQ